MAWANTRRAFQPIRDLQVRAPAFSRARTPTSCKMKTARLPRRIRFPQASTIRPLARSTPGSPTSIAPNMPPWTIKRRSKRPSFSRLPKASFLRSNPPMPSRASSNGCRSSSPASWSSSTSLAAATRTWTPISGCFNLPTPMTSAAQNSTRISKCFAELRAAGELGIVAYITAGDPSFDATHKFVLALAEAGADVIELGVPFSDPVADGPTIQRASERALKAGASLAGVLELVRRTRQTSQVPLVLFTYFNPILQMGLEKFAAAAAQAGADGVLVTDLTPEESEDYRRIIHTQKLDTIFLAAPTSDDERLRKISACSSGFLYLISRTGVTGAKDSLPVDLPGLLRRVHQFTELPVAVGFGIPLPGHVSVLGGLADAAVVGSSLVSEIEKASSVEAASAALRDRVKMLKEAGRRGLSRREATI